MKTVTIHCRACRVRLKLACDEDYAAERDPLALAALVVCDRCYDLHQRRSKIENWIADCCHSLVLRPHAEKLSELKQALYAATRKYAQVIAEQMQLEYVQWDDAFPESLLENPGAWPRLLAHYRKTSVTARPQPPKNLIQFPE